MISSDQSASELSLANSPQEGSSSPEPNDEKRIASRRRVFGVGVIFARDSRVNCVIRDLSATGAKLGVSRRAKLPQAFAILLLKTNTQRRVKLKWRRGDFAGVEFQ
jgi:hypothetical protein